MFEDPPTVGQLLTKVKSKTGLEILDLCYEVLPDWVVGTSTELAIELGSLNARWDAFTLTIGRERKLVVLVQDSYAMRPPHEQKNHRLIVAICDRLAELGYLVLESRHFELCGSCDRVIVSAWVMEQQAAKTGLMGVVYTGKCQTCQPQAAWTTAVS